MNPLHSWSLSPDEAVKVQAELCTRLILPWDNRAVETVGGFDVDLEEDVARAAIVVLRLSDLKPIEGLTAAAPLVFPYIPGLRAFREGPAVLAAWEKIQHKPEVVMFDGQGIAHPRGIGSLHRWDYGSSGRRSGWRNRGCMGGMNLSGQFMNRRT